MVKILRKTRKRVNSRVLNEGFNRSRAGVRGGIGGNMNYHVDSTGGIISGGYSDSTPPPGTGAEISNPVANVGQKLNIGNKLKR